MSILKRKKWWVWCVLYKWPGELTNFDTSMGVVEAENEQEASEKVEEFNKQINPNWTPFKTRISEIPAKSVKRAIPEPFLWREWLAERFFGRKIRVDAVVSAYLKASTLTDDQWRVEHGLARLQQAKSNRLKNQQEMDEACREIYWKSPEGRHPNWLTEVLSNDRLLEFLKWCEEHNMDITDAADCCSAIWLFNQDWFK